MYPELIKSPISDGKKYYLKKRPGTALFQSYPAGTGQGITFWNGQYVTAVGGTVYYGTTATITLSTTTGTVGFAEFRSDSIDELFVCDGTSGWVINTSGAATKITDANFPVPHIPNPVFLDGYIFLAQPASQIVRNSTLLDPTTWPTDGFIDAEMYPDNIVALTKAQNYLVAIGTQSCEFFYDNGNATGSPLQRNAPAVAQFGCPAAQSVNQTEKEVILVGATGNGGRTVWVLDGFQPTEIANEPVREALDLEGNSIGGCSAMTFQCAGHKWYIMNLFLSGRTFVYDFEEKMWHEWSSGTGQAWFNYKYVADSGDGSPVLLTYGGVGAACYTVKLSPSTYTDYGQTAINCVAITSKIDFDSIKRKRFYRLSLIGDSPNGATNTPIQVAWSDDDYNTWVSSGSDLQINGTYPTITQLGISRRRAFKFTYQQAFALRLEAFEVDIIQEVRR